MRVDHGPADQIGRGAEFPSAASAARRARCNSFHDCDRQTGPRPSGNSRLGRPVDQGARPSASLYIAVSLSRVRRTGGDVGSIRGVGEVAVEEIAQLRRRIDADHTTDLFSLVEEDERR